MNKSGKSFNFETITPKDVDEQSPELYLIEPNDSVPVLLNEHIVAPDRRSKDRSKQRKSKFVIKFLVVLNIVAVVLFYFRDELFVSSSIENTPELIPQVRNTVESTPKDSDQETKDHSSIVSDVLTNIATLENSHKTRKNVASKKPIPKKSIAKNTVKPSKKSVKAVRKASKSPVKTALVKPKILPSKSVSGNDIRNILDNFVKAYTAGDTQALLSLFKSGNESSVPLEKIRTNVDTLFSNTESRMVSLENMVWQYGEDKTIGHGKYQASAELTSNNGQQSLNADVKITIQRTESQYYITDFQLSKVETKVSTTTVPSLPLDPLTKVAMAPSKAELQSLVKKFISAYEGGDIQRLTSLFADNAVTNKRVGLEEIRQDYSELFKSSSDRRVFLKGLSWVYSKNHAKGSGKLDIFVTAVGGDIDHVIKGKVKIIAKRIQDSVVITHLYHSESK